MSYSCTALVVRCADRALVRVVGRFLCSNVSLSPCDPAEDGGREERSLSVPLQRSDHLHHPQEEVWLIKTQLHEPVRA